MRTLTLAFLLAGTTIAGADKVAVKTPPKQPAITPATAALIPDTGRLIAYVSSDQELVITRITKTGPKEVTRLATSYSPSTWWTDAKTLMVVYADDDQTIQTKWFVDGVLDPKRATAHKIAVWGQKDEAMIMFWSWKRTADNVAWVEACLKQVDTDNGPKCKQSMWLRTDAAVAKPQKAKPGKLLDFALPVPKEIKAPAGHTAKLTKIASQMEPKKKKPAVECTSPAGNGTWSDESPDMEGSGERFVPKKVKWISATPPIYGVEGLHYNPVDWEEKDTWYFRACAKRIDDLGWFGDGWWSETVAQDEKVTLYIADQPVAAFLGGQIHPAPIK
jgi:hypothetical protein